MPYMKDSKEFLDITNKIFEADKNRAAERGDVMALRAIGILQEPMVTIMANMGDAVEAKDIGSKEAIIESAIAFKLHFELLSMATKNPLATLEFCQQTMNTVLRPDANFTVSALQNILGISGMKVGVINLDELAEDEAAE